jgi:pSer/pThr/pTyr-binding forkhead associated (FHA) protein
MSENGQDQVPDRVGEPTTMRFQGIGEPPVDPSAEAPAHLSGADQATVDALRAGTALLVVLRGPNTGARFLLDADEVSSGRHPDSDIFLDDVTVSRKHASVLQRDGAFVIEDQGSLNGTFVNRKRVDSAPLDEGDEIQIGKYRMTFFAP